MEKKRSGHSCLEHWISEDKDRVNKEFDQLTVSVKQAMTINTRLKADSPRLELCTLVSSSETTTASRSEEQQRDKYEKLAEH